MNDTTQKPIRYETMAPKPPEGRIDLHSLLSGDGPLEIDIGFGRGRSLFSRLQASPESRIVGIEIKAKFSFKVDERIKREKLERLLVWNADAKDALSRVQPVGCVSRVFIHFPDPWWKKRHTKRMLIDAPFVDCLSQVLEKNGQLFVQTDVEERAEHYWKLIDGHPQFCIDHQGWLEKNPFDNASNREVRAIQDGLPVFRILATRK